MNEGWVDPLVARLWLRHRHRWLRIAWQLALVIFLVAVGVALTFHVLYHRPDPAVAVRTFVVVTGWIVLLHRFFLVPSWNRSAAPIHEWIASPSPTPEQTATAWECARGLTQALIRQTLTIGGLGTMGPVVFYLGVEYELRGVRLVVVGMSAGLAIAWALSTLAPVLEVFFRPLRRELGEAVKPWVRTRAVGVTMRTKLLAVTFLMSMLSGASVAVAATVGDRALEELGWLIVLSVVIPVTTGGAAIFLLARSLLAPIDDLMDATEQVAGGDLHARSTVTTDDEIGSFALRFNEMLASLERVASENRALLDEVRASRARIVAASDAERRRVERNLHDGAQQQLTALALRLRTIEARADDAEFVRAEIDGVITGLQEAHEELRELARGLHPSVLSVDGLQPALEQLAARATIPVEVDAPDRRWDETVEATIYYVASEALANVGKYAEATSASIHVASQNGQVTLEVTDDGIGGAHLGEGSGLRGLADRVAAVGGTFELESPPGAGTRIRARVPVDGDAGS